jgi:hypothetical protein
MTRSMTAAEYRAQSKPKANKYRAKKTVVDGITFDSMREAAYYGELKMREKAGQVCAVELQPRFPLMVGNEVIGSYRADFRFHDNVEKRTRVIDIKGVLTRETKRAIKHVLAQYGVIVEVVR